MNDEPVNQTPMNQTPVTHKPTPARSPTWWTPDQDRNWSHVKAAFRRDWEQTKADLTGGRKGADLNQNFDDTLGQAFGKRPIPGENEINPMTADELEAHVRRAARQMDRTGKQLATDAEKSIAKQPDQGRLNAHGWTGWEEAESPIRYGHGAAAYYGPEWDDATELRMRTEWEELNPTQRWEDVRDTVRLGWGGGR